MEVATSIEQQRAEIGILIRSGVFAKAPRLERFFEYICRLELAGEGDRIKEYSIAVEALGRAADFDPKKDSIVRVEAHRLRRRLDDYYQGPGLQNALRICIPNGQYRPVFRTSEQKLLTLAPEAAGAADSAAVHSDAIEQIELTAPAPYLAANGKIRFGGKRFWLVGLVLAVFCTVLFAAVWAKKARSSPALATVTRGAPGISEVWQSSLATQSVPGEIHLLAGYHGPAILDSQGRTWTADAYFNGGHSSLVPAGRIADCQANSPPMRAQRSGRFHYEIPLRHRPYELHLYLAETEYGPGNARNGQEESRQFGVSINGQPILTAFDPAEAAGGPNRLHERVFKDIRPAADGKLHLAFEPDNGDAILNALELLPSTPGRIRPIRLVAQTSPVVDSEGRIWAADKYYSGGRTVTRADVVSNSHEALFQGERYGNFSYRIPLAPGKYRVTLYFAETWFGVQSPQPAVGSRVFDVFANGRAILKNYQIAPDAGGANRGVQKAFENLEPDAHGLLLLEFIPLRNYAEINAIEVVETS